MGVARASVDAGRALDCCLAMSIARASSLAAVRWEPREPTVRNGFGCAGGMFEKAKGPAACIAWLSQTSTLWR